MVRKTVVPMETQDGNTVRTFEEVILTTEELSVSYGQKLALDRISMAISRNRITAIMGPSGCGKSTLLRCFNRMNELIPGARTEGRVLFHGQDIYRDGVDPTEVRSRIGMVFQKPNPFPKSVYENVAFGLRINGARGRLDDQVERALRQAALWDEVKDSLHQNAFTLSGGQQQRLCIARALAVGPEVLLMDEPTSALDPIAALAIEELIRQLSNEITIVIATHNIQQAARLSDYAVFLMVNEHRAGELVEMGPTRQVFTAPKDHRTEAYLAGRFG
jgi:phosphate transport system ATP-binding protein